MELERGHRASLKVQQAAKVILYLHTNFWPVVLFLFILIMILSIRTSHRIAGPIYRMTLVLNSLKEGTLSKAIHLRKGDRLSAEVEITNQMLETLRMKVAEIQKAQADLNDAIAACTKVAGHAQGEEMALCIKDIREKGSILEEGIRFFKIKE